jgi:hypothetical protein
MPATLKTRKPVVKLTAGDFRAFPVWEFAIDEEGIGKQDETWVRPINSAAIRKGAYSQLVASDFATHSGRNLQGFMVVSTADGKIEISAGGIVGRMGLRVLPALSRKLAVRRKTPWDIEVRDRLLLALRQTEEEVFPLRYSLRVPIRGEKEPRKGDRR